VFKEMALFIAGAQQSYFRTRDESTLANLNQQDLVKFLESKNHRLKKEHVSRMLDVLYFKTEGSGTVPAKHFFRRYGSKTRLSQAEKFAFAKDFLRSCEKGLTQLEKAKGLVEFIRHKGIDITLSDSGNDHNKYKQFKTVIQKIEGAKR